MQNALYVKRIFILLLPAAMRLVLLAFSALHFCSCEAFKDASPIPGDKAAFIGTWESKSGFIIEIKASGLADIVHNLSQGEPDYEKLSIKVAPRVVKDMSVNFKTDSILEIINSLQYAKEYNVERQPYEEDRQWKMVLNGVTLIRRAE